MIGSAPTPRVRNIWPVARTTAQTSKRQPHRPTLARILTATSAPQYSASHTSPKLPSPTHSTSRISAGETAGGDGQGRGEQACEGMLGWSVERRAGDRRWPVQGHSYPEHPAAELLGIFAAARMPRPMPPPTLQEARRQLSQVGDRVCVDAAARRAALDHSEARPPTAAALLALTLAQARHLAPGAQLQGREGAGRGCRL